MSKPVPNTALADAIKESGLRKDFIAGQLGVSQSLLSHWLSGKRTPDNVQRKNLALLLRRKPDDFLAATGHEREVSALPSASQRSLGNDLDAAA